MRTGGHGLARSLAPAVAVALSTLLVAAVGTALGWQDIVDEFDRGVADQLALLSRAKGEAIADRWRGAARVIRAVAAGQSPDFAVATAGLHDGVLVYRERPGSKRELLLAAASKRPPRDLVAEPLPAAVTLIEDHREPWLVVAYTRPPATRWLVAQPLGSIVAQDMLRQWAFATTTVTAGRLDSGQPGQPSAKARLIGSYTVAPEGQLISVTVSTERAAAVRPALARFLRFCLAMAVPLLFCICSLGAIAGRAVVASLADHRRATERQALHEISEALLSAKTLRETLQLIVDRAGSVFSAAGASMALLDEASGDLRFEVATGSDGDAASGLPGQRLAAGAGLAGAVVSTGNAVLITAETAGEHAYVEPIERLGAPAGSLMGVPLTDQQGLCFGALCLVAQPAQSFTAADLVLLRSLGLTAAVAVARAAAAERDRERDRLANELDIARTVQQGLLPAAGLSLAGYDVAGASEPAHEVGGDFYDFVRLDDRRISVVIADVADKGLGAAMFMVVCRSLYYACGAGRQSPSETLRDMNERLVAMNTSNLFVTVFHAVLNLDSGQLDYACAGHLPPIWRRAADGDTCLVQARGMALGVVDPAPVGVGTLTLDPGDAVVLYTDGVTDALDAQEQAFGAERLVDVVANEPGLDAESMVAAIVAHVGRHVGTTPRFDDTTLLVLHRADSRARGS